VIHKESGDADMYTARQPEQVTATVTPLSGRRSRPLFLMPHAAKGLQDNANSLPSFRIWCELVKIFGEGYNVYFGRW